MFQRYRMAIAEQQKKYGRKIEDDRQKTCQIYNRHHLLSGISKKNQISIYVMKQISFQWNLYCRRKKNRKEQKPRHHRLCIEAYFRSMRIPCSHMLEKRFDDNLNAAQLTYNDFHPHWWTAKYVSVAEFQT